MLRVLTVTVALLAAATARATPAEDIDTEAAHRHFDRGHTLYETGRYEEARDEFLEARRIRDLPAFDYNLAKCEERLEHWQRAIDAYEQYLARSTGDPLDGDVRGRIEILKRRLPAAVVSDAPRPRHDGLRNAAIGVGLGAIVHGAIGAGVYYASWGTYDSCKTTPCDPAQRTALHDSVRKDEIAGFTLVGAAGVAAIVDVALWIDWAKKTKRAPRSTP